MPGKGSRSTLALVIQTIVEALCVYAEAVKQSIVCTKHRKFSELRISEVASAGFSCRHYTANTGLTVIGSAGPVPLSLYNMCGYVH